ncbi:unnamed protein product [Cylindrotheca closterium]|uniref:Uncharacterized protein n=1 Tax=Cylindrotheca closterium TaxID=2856 RepID=A0AAD2GE34_9STRA|nr:unnamed protein product [Cylindrotheca closterium]
MAKKKKKNVKRNTKKKAKKTNKENDEEKGKRKDSLITIQKHWRGTQAREQYRTCHASCVVVQSITRQWLIRRKINTRIQSAIDIQKTWRGYSSTTKIKSLPEKTPIEQTRAATKIQSIYRMLIAEEAYHSRQQMSFLNRLRAATILQSFARRQIAHKSFYTLRDCITTVQSYARGRQLRKMLEKRAKAVIMIQKHTRGSIVRGYMRRLHSSAIVIQMLIRMALVPRRQFQFLQLPQERRKVLNRAAKLIQIAFLRWKLQLVVESMQCSAIILNRGIRGQLDRSAAKFALSHMNASLKNSASTPSFARLVAGNDPNFASKVAAWELSVLQAKLFSSIVLQRAARRFLSRRQESRQSDVQVSSQVLRGPTTEPFSSVIQWAFGRTKREATVTMRLEAAIRLQSKYRGWKRRQAYNSMLEDRSKKTDQAAAIRLQSVFRARRSRNVYHLLLDDQCQRKNRATASRIQNVSLLEDRSKKTDKAAVIRLQSVFRLWRSRQACRLLLDSQLRRKKQAAATTRIQTVFRVWRSRKVYDLLLEDQRQKTSRTAATRIQTAFRGLMGRNKYDLLWEEQHQEKHRIAVTRIQTAFRGLMERKAHRFISLDRSKQTDQASIDLQRVFRGTDGRILAGAYTSQMTDLSSHATASVLHAAELSSTATVSHLLDDQSSTSMVSPSLRQLIDRAKAAQAEACFLAANILPGYATTVLQKYP